MAWPYFFILSYKRQDSLFSFSGCVFAIGVFYILNSVLDIPKNNVEFGII